MHIEKKGKDPYDFEARISLEKAELADYLRQTTEELAEHVTIEGFRKGKAPKELVQQQLDPALIRQEALEHALGDSFTKASAQEQWDVMRTTELKVLKNDSDTLEYSIRVALWPTVTLGDLAAVKIPRRDIAVSDQEVQESLDTLCNMKATFLDKTGPIAIGDRAEINFDSAADGKPLQGGQSQNHPLIIGGKSFMPGFEEELVGLSAGQTKEFSLTAPEDYYRPELAGKKIDFKVTIGRVQSVLKPVADDAFAQTVGKFKDLAHLKEGLQENLRADKEAKERQRLQLAILDAIIAAGSVPAPENMVKEELDDMVHRFSDDLKGRGIELAMYLARMKKTEDDLRTDWKPEAERQVRIMLALRQVAKANDLAVAPEELEENIQRTVAEIMATGQVQENQIDLDRVRSAIAQRLLTDKTLEFLEDTCAVSV